MTIPEIINYYLEKEYDMEYNVILDILTIKEKISVKDFLKIKWLINWLNLSVKDIIVEG